MKLHKHRTLVVTVFLLAGWNLATWVITDSVYVSQANSIIQQETELAQERAEDLGDSIQRNLNYLHGIPKLYAQSIRVQAVVRKFGDSAIPSPLSKADRVSKWSTDRALRELNSYLEFSASSLNVDLLYVVNAAGDLIAASNWNSPASSIGINIAERELFKLNRRGKPGMQYAVGKTTKIPGLFFASPIFLDGKFYGATVAKVDVPNLSFLTRQLNAFITDENGVIILARDKKLEMYSLPDAAVFRLSSEDKKAMYLRESFSALDIRPWHDERLPSLVKMQNRDFPHILVSMQLPNFNLSVYVDNELDTIPALTRSYFWFTLLICTLGSLLILAAVSVLHYFRSIRLSKEQLWKQANFDTLTSLPNRDMLRDRLSQEIKKSKRSGLPLAILLIDLDQFKEVNDSYGHDVGDLLLVEAARRIKSCVRESDTVARLGGDEFIVLLPQQGNAIHPENIAQKVIDKISEPFQLQNETSHVSASLGITLYPNDAIRIADLMKNADQAMYVAKKDGRNRYSYFTQAMQESAQKRLSLIKDLRVALVKNQFRVYYQPIIELSSGHVHKVEALLRWLHPELGMVSPAEFIPLAEETRNIIEIGAWVRTESATWCKRWSDMCSLPFQVSINRSPVEFMDDGGLASITRFIEQISKQGLTGNNFVFEITEGMLLNLSASVGKELIALRDAGIQVALDDFGTGYSSLSYLNKLDIDYLKIDRSFVSNLATDADDLVLCVAIIGMAHKLGLMVIAEGVETSEQNELLKQAGCDYAQGYFYSRPTPPEEMEAWMMACNSKAV